MLMIEWIVWGITFIFLYLSIVWLNFLFLQEQEEDSEITSYPRVLLSVPSYNEEETIITTLSSLLALDYPDSRLRIIVVDDGSSDSTVLRVRSFLKSDKCAAKRTRLIRHHTNKGKGAALNTALRAEEADLFGVVDADSIVEPEALRALVPHFDDPEVGAVVSVIRVQEPHNFLERIQRIEYALVSFMRRLQGSLQALDVTPGVLSLYRRSVLLELGGFDEDNLAEDFEIGMRLKYYNHKVNFERRSFTRTKVPTDFRAFWKQRVRWTRGWLYNYWNYREMILNKAYGFLGRFQYPVTLLGIPLLFLSVGIIIYKVLSGSFLFMKRLIFVDGFLHRFFYIPKARDVILSQNLRILVPLYISALLVLVMVYLAHGLVREKRNSLTGFLGYFLVFPYVMVSYTITGLWQEWRRFKKEW